MTHGRHGVTAAGAPCGQLVVTMGTTVSRGRSLHDARPTRRHRGRCFVWSAGGQYGHYGQLGAEFARRTADTATPRPVLRVVSWRSLWALRSVGGRVCTTHGRHDVTAAGAPCGQLEVTMGTMVSRGRSLHDARPTRRHRARPVVSVVSRWSLWALRSVGGGVCTTHGRHDVTSDAADDDQVAARRAHHQPRIVTLTIS